MEDKSQYPSEPSTGKDQSPTDLPPPDEVACAKTGTPARDSLHPGKVEEIKSLDDQPDSSGYPTSGCPTSGYPTAQANPKVAPLHPPGHHAQSSNVPPQLDPQAIPSPRQPTNDRDEASHLEQAWLQPELPESELRQHIEQLQSEKSSWQRDKELLLRQLANFDNLRKRAERELDNARKYAISDFAKEILVIGDNLQRALDTIGTDNPALEQYRKGLELVMQEFCAVLTKLGVTKLEPLLRPFDARYHRPVQEQPHHDHPTGTVIQVIQAGYTLHARLLREALVIVSKAVPQDSSTSSDTNPNTSGDNSAPRIDV